MVDVKIESEEILESADNEQNLNPDQALETSFNFGEDKINNASGSSNDSFQQPQVLFRITHCNGMLNIYFLFSVQPGKTYLLEMMFRQNQKT